MTFAPELLGVTDACESWQLASEGAPLHDRLTAWLKPPMLVAATVYVAVAPGLTVCEEDEPVGTARLKSWPVALRARVCGLPPALSVNERLPEAAPPAVGVKVIGTVHDPDAATGLETEQVVPEAVIAKGPVVPIAVKVRFALPVFVTLTVCGGLVVPTGSGEKVGGAGKLTMGPVPVPLKLTVCGLLAALSANEGCPKPYLRWSG